MILAIPDAVYGPQVPAASDLLDFDADRMLDFDAAAMLDFDLDDLLAGVEKMFDVAGGG